VASADELAALDKKLSDVPLPVVLRFNQLADEFETAVRSGSEPDPDAFGRRLEESGDVVAIFVDHLHQLRAELTESQAVASGLPFPEGPAAFDEYQLLDRLGAGGMGVVYKAIHTRLDRTVAVKFPRFAVLLDEATATRFIREAKLLGQLRHDHIVQALDAGDSPYGPYLVTEFIEGETVEQLVRRRGPLSFEHALTLAAEAASGLAHAHAKQIIHRDVKPSNLLLDQAGSLRVVDFGLAKALAAGIHAAGNNSTAHDTGVDGFLGTVAYAAPEQLHSYKPVDQRADVYSLGCVLYFMLTGDAFHRGTLADRLVARNGSRSVPKIERNDVPAQFNALWRGMVADDPSERPDSMVQVERQLQRMLDGHFDPVVGSWSRRQLLAMAGSAALGGAVVWRTISPAQFGNQSNRQRSAPTGPTPPGIAPPLVPTEVQRRQQAWAAYLGVPLRWVNAAAMPFVLLPPGEFQMGPPDERLPEPIPPQGDWRFRDPAQDKAIHAPQHRVILTRPIYFGETEVTNAQFRQFVDATGYVTDAERDSGWGREDKGWVKRSGYSWKNLGQRLGEDDQPVVNVTWNDAKALCEWLTSLSGNGRCRMPTEAEWEFAARAGSTTSFHFGDNSAQLGDFGWFGGNSDGRYRAVGSKQPNPLGIFDLYGNRQEWCLDHYSADFYRVSQLKDPLCSNGSDRVMRGGAHTDLPRFCSSVTRWEQEANNPGAAGIRVVCEIDAP
jgi:eukaryotic-like serine/threonine-protein kinase